uniref:Ig-like domain-containing protein n=1 Tax=Sus scrofa TaxID=9823 RepID=A0A8D1VFN8_PIG
WTPMLPARLCLGEMSCDLVSQVFPGTLPKPILWPEPDPLVTWGSPVTIWCQGTLGAQECHLYAEGRPALGDRLSPLEAGDKAKFFIQYMTQDYAGRYQCYCHSPTGRSEPSDALELVVTGERTLRGPSLRQGSALRVGPSHSPALGELRDCEPHPHVRGWLGGRGSRTRTQSVRDSETWGPGGTRGSWGKQPLTQGSLSPGGSGKPSLLTPQGPVVASGQSLTLQCRSAISYDRFALAKEGARDLPQPPARQPQAGLSQAHFSLGEVRGLHGGRYRCYSGHNLSSLWSAPRDPLDILVAGQLRGTPSLSGNPGPSVATGQNVTLLSWSPMDTFLLSKEGAAHPLLRLRSQPRAGLFLAEFSMIPVASAHGGTYRCHGSLSSDPYLLSHPSDPLELMRPCLLYPPLPSPGSGRGREGTHPEGLGDDTGQVQGEFSEAGTPGAAPAPHPQSLIQQWGSLRAHLLMGRTGHPGAVLSLRGANAAQMLKDRLGVQGGGVGQRCGGTPGL